MARPKRIAGSRGKGPSCKIPQAIARQQEAKSFLVSCRPIWLKRGVTRTPAISDGAASRSLRAERAPIQGIHSGSRFRRFGGSGLGLAIVREIAQQHGAEIEINARPTGTWIFWVLGIVALLVFCYGLVRGRKAGTRRRDELARDIQL